MAQAPWDDKSWEIWVCSPALAYPVCKRADVVFELHDESYWQNPEVVGRLNASGARVWMQHETMVVPKSEKFPLEDLIVYYRDKGYTGYRYFTSTIAYMLAYALYEETYERIGLWGVHMAAEEEWQHQRQAMEYWVGVANGLNIRIDIPQESEICAGRRLYGYSGDSTLLTEIRKQQAAFDIALSRAKSEVDAKVQQMYECSGAAKILAKLHRQWS